MQNSINHKRLSLEEVSCTDNGSLRDIEISDGEIGRNLCIGCSAPIEDGEPYTFCANCR